MRDDQDASRSIYDGSFFRIGQFRRGPKHSNFTGPHVAGSALIVFPRTSVTITHAGKKPVVADPNVVMFYNDRQVYSRGRLSEKGDLCDWFGFKSELIAQAVQPFDEYVSDHPQQPFQFPSGPSDPRTYLMQRSIVDTIVNKGVRDELFIEESVLTILKHVIYNSYHQQGVSPHSTRTATEKEVTDGVQKMLSIYFRNDLSLEQIARHFGYSAFHLCRIFRKHTGQTIHQYLKQIRLRTSLEYVTQANTDLTTLAMELGFSSHSHFTEAFRKTFGAPPSQLRNVSRQQMHQLLSKISIA